MAEGYRRSNGRISATLLPLLKSEAFAASLDKPAKFKEPLDYVISVARAACAETPVENGLFLRRRHGGHGTSTVHAHHARRLSQPGIRVAVAPAMAKRVRLAMGTAADRVPFARPEEGVAARPGPMAEGGKGRLMRGTPCRVDESALERAVGPLSSTTEAAAKNISERERIGLLLASPEFMRR